MGYANVTYIIMLYRKKKSNKVPTILNEIIKTAIVTIFSITSKENVYLMVKGCSAFQVLQQNHNFGQKVKFNQAKR